MESNALPLFENGTSLQLYRCDFAPDSWKREMHSHAYIELAVIWRGKGLHRINDAVYPVSKGEVYIINTDSRHCFSPLDEENSGGLSIVYIGFYPEVLYGAGLDPGLLGDIRNMLLYKAFFETEDKYAVDILLTEEELAGVYERFLSMVKEQEEKKLGYEDILKLELAHLLVALCRLFYQAERRVFPLNDYKVTLIKKVIDYFNQYYSDNLTLDSLSAYVSMSKRHLARVFRENTGLSIMEYLQKLRIEKACYLLVTTDQKPGDIAAMVGYGDYHHFSGVFRKYTGMTCREYRRQQQGKPVE